MSDKKNMIICPNAPVPRATYPEQNHFHQRRDNQLEMGATQRCEMSNLLHTQTNIFEPDFKKSEHF